MNTANVAGDAIIQRIAIKAPAERIFKALTDPRELLKWWAAEGKFHATHVESDLRSGGKWMMRVKGSGGTEITVAGEYLTIEAPRLLIYTWIREEDSVETHVRWDLEEREGVTHVCVTHSGLTSESLRVRNSGWPLIVGLLQTYVQDQIVAESKGQADFRLPTASRWDVPRAVADGGGGTIIATVEVAATPARVFHALTSKEVERWWGHPDFYRMTDWSADLRVTGQWSVVVRFADGNTNGGSGEFAEIDDIDEPRKLVMTRKFEKHPLLGSRETTITYRFDPVATGTRLTVRDEGFIGRSEAAYGNAEHWERVLGWLKTYLSSTTATEEDSANGHS
jgi:uncharacterized protein YndB with AHSA1/START domain